ncbi:ameloblastin isoform X2 [Anguilla rostrata]|uniref:ameloblastin isoform X2 n=1 Tax=Anguilla rostrata TaxID=7938 RepID=UPI0030CA8031
MRVAIVFLCLLVTVCGGPVHRLSLHHILQQAQQHQQRHQSESSPNQEALQELAHVRHILEQYAKVFPPVNTPAVQPQNHQLNIPQLALPSGTPLESPPQVPPTAVWRPDQQVVPEAVSVQPMTQAPELGTEAAGPAAPNEQQPQVEPPVLGPVQPNTWAPQPGVPFLLPLPPNTQGTQPTDQPALPAQFPQMFPSYGFLPMFPSQTGTQQFPGYGMPVFFPNGYPQLSVHPAEADQTVQTGQPVQPVQPVLPAQPAVPGQQQIPQIFYMIQQPMVGPFGSASSEELQATGAMGGFGMFLPGFGSGISNPGVGAVVPGGLPAGQGVDPGAKADPALAEVPPTSGAPLLSAPQPAGPETTLSKDPAAGLSAGKPTVQSNLPQPGLTTGSEPAVLPVMSSPASNPNARSVAGAETDLYP